MFDLAELRRAIAGDARAYLDGRDSWLSSGYSIEGYFAEVTQFGVSWVYLASPT